MLQKLTDRISYLPHEKASDRPALFHVRGERLSLAIDAGYSPAHVGMFYEELSRNNLPLPNFTAITHWHWDHTFGMSAVCGHSLACAATNRLLVQEREALQDSSYYRTFFEETVGFADEFPHGTTPRIVTSSIEFQDELMLDLGGVHARLLHAPSPHTDDAVLVHIPEERALFLGDSLCEDFDTHVTDKAKLRELLDLIERLDPHYCLESHWIPETLPEMLDEMCGML